MIESAVPHTVMPVKSLGAAADPTKVPPLPPMLMVDVVRYVPGGKNSTSPSFIALRALWIEVVQSFLSSPTAPNDSTFRKHLSATHSRDARGSTLECCGSTPAIPRFIAGFGALANTNAMQQQSSTATISCNTRSSELICCTVAARSLSSSSPLILGHTRPGPQIFLQVARSMPVPPLLPI